MKAAEKANEEETSDVIEDILKLHAEIEKRSAAAIPWPQEIAASLRSEQIEEE